MNRGIAPHPAPLPSKLALASLPFECPHPQADADGRGDALATGTAELPLQPHPLADAATLRCRLAKASLRGEGWGEGRFPQFIAPSRGPSSA